MNNYIILMDQNDFSGSLEPHPDSLPDPPRDAPAAARPPQSEICAMPDGQHRAGVERHDTLVERQDAFVERQDAFVERQDGAWRVLPIEGRFELVYEDGKGAWSVRRIQAHELKIGPGRVLLGGTDRDRDGYRGFRADRIHRLTDRDTGERVERAILDWLIRRADAARRARAAARRREARRSGPRAA